MPRRAKQSNKGGEHAAREKCLRLLSLRPRSQAELKERLRRDGYEETVTETVLRALQEVGLVDDREFARSWIASRLMGGGSSRRRLTWELRRKGVAEAVVRELVADGVDDETEMEQARRLALRRLRPEVDDARASQRLTELLRRRGFDYETVRSVMREVGTEEDD